MKREQRESCDLESVSRGTNRTGAGGGGAKPQD